MATKSKLELAVDAGKWEDGLRKAQNSMKAFEQSIGGLEKATSSEKEKMAQFIQILGNTKSTAATASQQVKEYRSTIERLQVISTKLNDEQKKLAEDAMAKLTQRMREAKGQADELNKSFTDVASEADNLSKTGSTTGTIIDKLAGHFGLSGKEAGALGLAVAGAEAAMSSFTHIIEGSQTATDAFGRAQEAATSIVDNFFESISQGSFDSFITGLQNIITNARDAYDALDRLSTFNAFNTKKTAEFEKRRSELRANIRTGVDVDGSKKALQELEKEEQAYYKRSAQLNKEAADAKLVEYTGSKKGSGWITPYMNMGENGQEAARKEAERIRKQFYQRNTAEGSAISATSMVKSQQNRDTDLSGGWTDKQMEQKYNALVKFSQMSDKKLSELSGMYAQATNAETTYWNKVASDARLQNAGGGGKSGGSSRSGSTTQTTTVAPLEGSIAEAEKRLQDLQKAFKAAATEAERVQISLDIDEAKKELDQLNGSVEFLKTGEIKLPVTVKPKFDKAASDELKKEVESAGIFTNVTLGKLKTDYQQTANNAQIGSSQQADAMAMVADITAFENIRAQYKQLGTDMGTDMMNNLLRKIGSGEGIEDADWQGIVDTINEQLAKLKLQPIKLDVETGNITELKDTGDETAKAWKGATSAIGSIGSALSSIEDPGAKVAGMIAQAIAQIASSFAGALSAESKFGVWDWIAGAAAGTATMVSTIAAIKSATEYHADGGVVGKDVFVPRGTDTVPAMLTPGEIVLNAAQQRNMASNLQGNSNITMQSSGESRISGEDLVTVINAYGRRTGRGEILV